MYLQFSLLFAGKTSSLSCEKLGKVLENQSPQGGDPGGVTLAWLSHSLASQGTRVNPPSSEPEFTFQSGAATNPGRKGLCQHPQSSSSPRKVSWHITPTTPKSSTCSVQSFPLQSPNHSCFPFQQPHCNTPKPGTSRPSQAVPVELAFSVSCFHFAVPNKSFFLYVVSKVATLFLCASAMKLELSK